MIVDFTDQIIAEKEKKTLNKPFRTPGGPKKFSVYVKNEKGNVAKVDFSDPNMEIKRDSSQTFFNIPLLACWNFRSKQN